MMKQLTETEEMVLDDLVRDFQRRGSLSFGIETDRAAYELFGEFLRANNVPTMTDIDRENGVITVFRRPWGSMEG